MSESSSSNSSDSSSSGDASRSIQLLREAQTRFTANSVDGYRFKVTAHDPINMPAEIFLYVRRDLNPTIGSKVDEFSNVCSLPDLEEYPIGEPVGSVPFYRDSFIDLVVRSPADAIVAWTVLRRDIDVLVETMNKADILAETDDVTIGG